MPRPADHASFWIVAFVLAHASGPLPAQPPAGDSPPGGGLHRAAQGTAGTLPYEETLRAAGEALENGDPATSLPLIDAALRVRPEGVEALTLLGRCLTMMERREDAVRAFDRAAALAPDGSPATVRALYGRADALARLERNVEAVETLGKILSIDRNHPAVHHDLGRIHLVLGRFEEAIEEFRLEIAVHTKDTGGTGKPLPGTVLASSWEGLGIAAYRSGDDATAIDAFSRIATQPPAAAISANALDSLYHHGLALARAGRVEDGAVLLRRAIEHAPDHRGALQNLARVEIALGRRAEGERYLRRFEALYMEDVEANGRRLRVRDLRKNAEREALAGNFEAATRHLDEARSLAPSDVEILMDLGRWRYRAGDAKGSEATLRDVIAIDPLRADAHHLIGRLRHESGDAVSAIASFERAVRLSPMSVEYHVQLAQAYLRARRASEGVAELQFALRLDPDDPAAFFNLGVALAQAGDLQGAARNLEQAARLGYGDPRVHQVLSTIYRALGDTERSLQEQKRFEQLLSEGAEGAQRKKDDTGRPPGGSP